MNAGRASVMFWTKRYRQEVVRSLTCTLLFSYVMHLCRRLTVSEMPAQNAPKLGHASHMPFFSAHD